jgi:hypothetical protein
VVTYLMLARLPEGAAAGFDAYENSVLPLLGRYGGRLERRLRGVDDGVEAHVVSFPDEAAFAAYREDPDRHAALPLLHASGAEIDLWAVRDLPGPHPAPEMP